MSLVFDVTPTWTNSYAESTPTTTSGSWSGSGFNHGANGSPLENHDKSKVVSDSAPNVAEGLNTGDYNPFFSLVTEAEAEKEQQKIRDVTRFQRAYSFHRYQPIRIRVFKR
jgi:hypothetical protein